MSLEIGKKYLPDLIEFVKDCDKNDSLITIEDAIRWLTTTFKIDEYDAEEVVDLGVFGPKHFSTGNYILNSDDCALKLDAKTRRLYINKKK